MSFWSDHVPVRVTHNWVIGLKTRPADFPLLPMTDE